MALRGVWRTQALLVYYAAFLAYDMTADARLIRELWLAGSWSLSLLVAAIVVACGVLETACLTPCAAPGTVLLSVTRLQVFVDLGNALRRPSYYTIRPLFSSSLFACFEAVFKALPVALLQLHMGLRSGLTVMHYQDVLRAAGSIALALAMFEMSDIKDRHVFVQSPYASRSFALLLAYRWFEVLSRMASLVLVAQLGWRMFAGFILLDTILILVLTSTWPPGKASPWQYAIGLLVYVDVRAPDTESALFHPTRYWLLRSVQAVLVPHICFWLQRSGEACVPSLWSLMVSPFLAALLFFAVRNSHWHKRPMALQKRQPPLQLLDLVDPTSPVHRRLQPLFLSPRRSLAITSEIMASPWVSARRRSSPASPRQRLSLSGVKTSPLPLSPPAMSGLFSPGVM